MARIAIARLGISQPKNPQSRLPNTRLAMLERCLGESVLGFIGEMRSSSTHPQIRRAGCRDDPADATRGVGRIRFVCPASLHGDLYLNRGLPSLGKINDGGPRAGVKRDPRNPMAVIVSVDRVHYRLSRMVSDPQFRGVEVAEVPILNHGWRRADCLGEGGGPTRVTPPRFATTRGWARGSFGFGLRRCALDAEKNRVQ